MYSCRINQHYVIAEAVYTYKLKQEDGDITIRAYDEAKKEAGSLTFLEEYVDDGTFDPYEDQPFYEKISEHETVVNIRDLHVEPAYRSSGIASTLMKRALKAIKSRFSGVPIYINASPYGESLSLDTLVAFYTKFGFKVLKKYTEHRNALLWQD